MPITDAVVTTGYRGEQLEQHGCFVDERHDEHTGPVNQESSNGTAGAVGLFLE